MGRIISNQLVGFECNIKSCETKHFIHPLPADRYWEQTRELASLITNGWSVVLSSRIRTYCPEHADRARACSCKTNPTNKSTCVVHSGRKEELLWNSTSTPKRVAYELQES